MVDRARVTQWLNDYVAAWTSYDRAAIEALFTEDAVYRYSPYDEGERGREAIVESWLANRDEAGTFSARYEPVAVDGDTAVAQGRTHYTMSDGKTPLREFDNVFVLKFAPDGRVREFCEWYMEPRGQT